MPEAVNRQITLAARPEGLPKPTDFRLVEVPRPQPEARQVLVRTVWLSLDPYQRGRMSAARSYAAALNIGEPMVGSVVGRVEESRHPGFAVGDIVEGPLGWQDYALSDGSNLTRIVPSAAPLSTALGVVGMPGCTAYFGLLDIGRAKPRDTVVVSAAAGPVGATACQIAKLMGCRVIGIAGGPEKCGWLAGEVGLDGVIDYKREQVGERLDALAPGGVDVYFDNVGGDVSWAVFERIATFARIAVCGQMSQYNLAKPASGPRNLWFLLRNQARMEGFLVFQFAARYGEARQRLTAWLRAGKLKYREDVTVGLENAPAAFLKLMRGENFGKTLVKVAE